VGIGLSKEGIDQSLELIKFGGMQGSDDGEERTVCEGVNGYALG
jgi:hypothetical protein